MLTRWAGWPAALLVTLLTIALVLGDLLDQGVRRWWAIHTLTTSTVSGLLVLLITVLVADQLLSRRQARDRARAVAAQAAIVVAQAARAGKAVAGVTADRADDTDQDARDAAADEVRTYMMMLLVAAPVLIENRVSRHFLEEAQHLGGVLAATLTSPGRPAAAPTAGASTAGAATTGASTAGTTAAGAGWDDAVARLRAASIPLLRSLNPEQRAVANATELLE